MDIKYCKNGKEILEILNNMHIDELEEPIIIETKIGYFGIEDIMDGGILTLMCEPIKGR